MQEFDWPVRVYYEDTDSGGVVYHSNYLNFMERARTEWLRNIGFEQDQLIVQHQCIFAVHSVQINFKKPARFNDALVLKTQLEKVSGASMVFLQKVYRGSELLTDATVRVACLDSERFRAKSMPAELLTRMQGDC